MPSRNIYDALMPCRGWRFNVARDSVAGSPACAHCGNLYDCMASLRSHIAQGRCPEFQPDATAETLPMNIDWLQACTGGHMKILFTSPQKRMTLTLHCQLCGTRYSRATDLSCHLQGGHARIWRCSQQLTLILVRLFYAHGHCVCNPAQHQNRLDHVCLPLRHLAMLFQMMENKMFAPFQATEYVLRQLLSVDLPQPVRCNLDQLAAQHCFENLWQDPQMAMMLSQHCLFCGRACEPCALPQHLREAHPCNHLALSFYIAQLVPLMLASQEVDYQCYACNQIFNLPIESDAVPDPNRKLLARSHLLYNCPSLLQIALFLTGLLHDGRLHDDSDRFTDSAASAGDVQGASTFAGHGTALPRPKRAKTKQAPAQRATTATAGDPTAAAATADHSGSPAGPSGPATRKRTQSKPQSRQLRTFFQPRSKRRLAGIAECHENLAGTAQDQHHPDDDLAAPSDPVPVPGPHAEGAQDFGGPAYGSVVPGISPEPADRPGGELALLGMESDSQEPDHQLQDAHQHDTDEAACQRTGGDVQGPRSGPVLSVLAEQPGFPSLPMETPVMPPCGQGMGIVDQTLLQQRVDPPGHDAETPHSDSEQPGGHHPAESGTSHAQGQREGQASPTDQPDGPEVRPQLAVLLHVLSHLRLQNDSNWCYANSTIFSLIWALLSMQCEAASLGIHFAHLIQFMPCHNLQRVALVDLDWFDQILRNWTAFSGDQRGRQQDASEFAAAVMTWLQAPAVNMTWERRLEEMDLVHVHDHGDKFLPIKLHLPETHVHLPDTQFTLTHLVRAWMQEDGMIAALKQAPQCICLHLDRFYARDDMIHKSACLIDMEAGCDIPVFIDGTLRREYVGYVLVAATAHQGATEGGHFQAILKTRPAVQMDGKPMHWILKNDDSAAEPVWLVPDWFRSNTNVFWLLRGDCVQLHTFQPLPPDASDNDPDRPVAHALEPEPTMPVPTPSMPSALEAPAYDETTAAIMALLRTTTMAERQR